MTTWRWAALVSLAFLAISLSFGAVPGMQACGVAPEPILAFELVNTPAEVAALFPESCRAVHAAAQRQALWLDILTFVPVYSAFLILSLVALRRDGAGNAGLVRAAIAAVLVAALADQWENSRLLAILAALPGDQATIDALWPAPRLKFLLLALIAALIGWLHFSRGGWQRIVGVVALLGGLASAAGVFLEPHLMLGASAAAWLALVLASWVLAWRKASPA